MHRSGCWPISVAANPSTPPDSCRETEPNSGAPPGTSPAPHPKHPDWAGGADPAPDGPTPSDSCDTAPSHLSGAVLDVAFCACGTLFPLSKWKPGHGNDSITPPLQHW